VDVLLREKDDLDAVVLSQRTAEPLP